MTTQTFKALVVSETTDGGFTMQVAHTFCIFPVFAYNAVTDFGIRALLIRSIGPHKSPYRDLRPSISDPLPLSGSILERQ